MSLKENYYYHIYNRGINSKPIFRSKKDYQIFLSRYFFYCFLSLDTFTYCLLNNHFHFFVRVRTQKEQEGLFHKHKQQDNKVFHNLKYPTFKPQSSSTQLGHLFNSYTRSFNNDNKVTGPVLEGRFKRIEVNEPLYRAHLVCYIHRNPIHHQLTNNYSDYPWSSYSKFMNNDDELINCEEVFTWFDGFQGFMNAHEEMKLKIDPLMLLE